MSSLRMLLELFMRFLKIGIIGFGGGWAILPIIEREIVEDAGWISKDEYLNLIAIAGSTPGPIAVNAATYIGFKMAGFIGAIVATVAVILPPFTVITTIVYFLSIYINNKIVQSVLNVLKAGVIGLITLALYTTFKEVYLKNMPISNLLPLAIITIYVIITIGILKIHPFLVILSLIPIGIALGLLGLI
ncbi:MAG: chromate transporter [Staphylothermus sp.]|nr:chromate transporter [Staphylothermus sp.]